MLKLRMGQALNPTDPEGHIQLGKTYRELGEYEKAIESFQNAIAFDDEHHHAYNNLGLVYTDIGMFALAIDMFLAALELAPGNPAFYNNLGYAYDMTDQFEEALPPFKTPLRRSQPLPMPITTWQTSTSTAKCIRMLFRITRLPLK